MRLSDSRTSDLSSHFSSSFDGPHSFYNAFSMVINLVVHINASTDVVGDDAKPFSHPWLVGRRAQFQMAVLLGHGYKFYLGMLGNISKACFIAVNQPIPRKRILSNIDHRFACNHITDDSNQNLKRALK